MGIDYFLFEHPEALAVGIFIIVFAVGFEMIFKVFNNKAIALVISLIISSFAGFQLYKERFYGFEMVLAVVLILVVIVIFAKIIFGLGRNFKGVVGK